MEKLFDLSHTLTYAGISIVLAVLLLLCSLKAMAILQQCGYKNKKAFSWYCRKDNMLFQRYMLLSTMLLLITAILGVSFALLGGELAADISLIAFPVFCILFYVFDKKYALKVPVKETERLKRLALVYYVVSAVVIYLLVALLNVLTYLSQNTLLQAFKYVPLALLPLAANFLLFFANLLDKIYENPHNKKYIGRAKEKLQNSNAIKIGITGSFAKTSVKCILAQLLSKKYTVLSTPASFNTPMGIAKAVNEGKEGYQVFIAEMGARKRGDIAELCEMVHPDYSVLTGVCAQHIESFETLENVLSTKSEIISSTKNKTFVGKDECTAELKGVCFVEEGVQYKNVVCTAEGTAFTLLYGGSEIKIETKLLGKHSALNIALAAQICFELGVSAKDVQEGCRELGFVEHRLQKIEGENGVIVLDDSYNANERGVKESLAVLQLFQGKKVVITPGIVEAGVLQEEINGKVGELLTAADEVILVGDTLVGAVANGYLAHGGDKEKLHTVFTLEAAKKLLPSLVTKGDVVLF